MSHGPFGLGGAPCWAIVKLTAISASISAVISTRWILVFMLLLVLPGRLRHGLCVLYALAAFGRKTVRVCQVIKRVCQVIKKERSKRKRDERCAGPFATILREGA